MVLDSASANPMAASVSGESICAETLAPTNDKHRHAHVRRAIRPHIKRFSRKHNLRRARRRRIRANAQERSASAMTQRVGEKRGRTQWRAPSVTAGFRRWNDGGYPNLATGPRDNNQAEPKPGEKDQQLRRPGTQLDARDVAGAFMIGIARMG